MRKFRSLLTLVLAFVSLFSLHAREFTSECDGYTMRFKVLDEDKMTCSLIIRPWASSEDIVENAVLIIPSTIMDEDKQYTLTAIEDWAFESCEMFNVIELPETVTTIGNCAFVGCSFYQIKLPEDLETIGSSAFAECKNLTSIKIPAGITELPRGVFNSCENLEYCDLSNVRSIGALAFSNCSSLTTLDNFDSVEKLGHDAFSECTGLREISLPIALKEIADSSFKWCTSLKSVIIGDKVEKINLRAFEGCENLTDLTIGEAVSNIESFAFAKCSKIERITMRPITPPFGHYDAFTENTYVETELIVPEQSENAYRKFSIWQLFSNYQSGVEEITEIAECDERGRYSTSGVPVDDSYKGLVLIRYTDGTTRKVVVK